MSLESTSSRCEQVAQHLLVFGELLDPRDMVRRIEAVDRDAATRAARRIVAQPPTLAALGPIGRVEAYETIRARLAH
jgi:predicted Zn-dependent peptidase